jgi:hypothetical protein
MRKLKLKIDLVIASQVQTALTFSPAPLPPPAPIMSLDHIPILELEQLDRLITDEVVSCVSFISGTLSDDFVPTRD